MKRLSRRQILALGTAAAAGGCLAGSIRPLLRQLARGTPPEDPLSDAAIALMDRTWAGISRDRYLDTHVHIVGLGTGNSGCWVNPKVRDTFSHPMERTRFEIYRMAAGVEDLNRADEEWVERLLGYARSPLMGGRVLILAFDQVYDAKGQLLTGSLADYAIPRADMIPEIEVLSTVTPSQSSQYQTGI